MILAALAARFEHLLAGMYVSTAAINAAWYELHRRYTGRNRHYHNFEHLANIFAVLDAAEEVWVDRPVLDLAVFYHDAVYSALRKDNEARSAQLAVDHLTVWGLAPARIERCRLLIEATLPHTLPAAVDDVDGRYFMDADLEALAWDWPRYLDYAQRIRREYWMYPGFMYRRGRKAVLSSFLERERFYLTDEYQRKWETAARANLAREVRELL